MTTPRVWSLTPFFNEVDVLDARLAELDSIVDVHVISESRRTYAGVEKPLWFAEHRERFAPYLDKIRYVVTDRMSRDTHQRIGDRVRWQRENGQRAALADALADLAPYDVVIVSDVDEIPRAELVQRYVGMGLGQLVCPPLPMHLYRVGLRVMAPQASLLRFCRGVLFKQASPEDVRRMPPRRMPDALIRGFNGTGWHLSYTGGVDAVRYKVAQAAHPEENIAAWLEPDELQRCIRDGADHRRNRTHTVGKAPPASWPACVAEDRKRFRVLIDPLRYPARYDDGLLHGSGGAVRTAAPAPPRQRRARGEVYRPVSGD